MRTPASGRWILSLLLPPSMRDAVIGDLEEGYRRAPAPRRWFWSQVLRATIPAAGMRWRRPGVLRVAVAVIAAYIFIVAAVRTLSALLAPVLRAAGRDSIRYEVLTLLAASVAAMAAGVVIPAVVPLAPRRAARMLAAILLPLGPISAAPDFGRVPLWYSLALIAAGPLAAWWGARNALFPSAPTAPR